MTNKFTKPCQHCGEPMLVARGKVEKKLNPRTGKLNLVKNPDQSAKYHAHCKKEGRRLAHKVFKKHRKAQNV